MAEEKDYVEVETIFLPLADSAEVEHAVLCKFEFEGKKYMSVSPIEEDAIADDEYIYLFEEDGEDYLISSIEDDEEFEKVAAYLESLYNEE